MFTTPDRRVMTLLLAGLLTLFAATTAQAAASATDIHVSGQGLQPAAAFAAVGAPVVWHNDTDAAIRISDQPFTPEPAEESPKLYLPSLSAPARSQAAASPNAHAAVHWVSDPIAPGQVYTRTYDAPGDFNFFVSSLPGITGTVTVLANTSVGSELIDAEQGGSVQVDNVTLTVPPGALAQDTVITLARPAAFTVGADGLEYVRLEPSGLTFGKPVTLTLAYTDSAELDEDFLNVAVLDELTGIWTYEPIIAQDQEANAFSVQVDHFSWRLAWVDEPVYLALEIPGMFLRPGDILVRMNGGDPCTETAVWLPGHTGIYSETVGSELAQNWIIESNSFDNAWRWTCTWSGGVRAYPMDLFLRDTCDFYLGARRNPNAGLEDQEEARNHAVAQIEDGYVVVGQGNVLDFCYSCVGLVEDAYDTAGASIIPAWQEAPFITPLQQFKNTVPVDTIVAQPNQLIRIPVRGIVKQQAAGHTDFYRIGDTDAVTVTGLPPGSAFADGIFSWTPTAADGGKDYIVIFWAAGRVGNKDYTESQSLTIHVAPVPNQPPFMPSTPFLPMVPLTNRRT